ncbi:hypothetical protein FXF51_05885 [Nonomuraea sp. PA05]|uniref:hypothetical protein n=1 Tax=Nonomuraea sp. PA05 TaxID=2604466 RepID=UPI0011D6FC13|nr:hypothetical protein [Nonomuraea sp. PA05]TYB69690.1 hypothetical protein FXF51_05885 [Nonomuraea sp. PA05]
MRGINEPPVKVWLVWSNEHDAWWGPARRGYTHDVWAAGRYAETDAAVICRRAAYGWREGALPPEVMVSAPENDQDKFSVDDLRHMPERMAARAEEVTREAIAKRRAEQDSEVSR